ncbi:FMN-binding protein [bacterium]|nr:FMN-binding protein [bacterium]
MLEKTGRRWLRVIHIILVGFLMGGLIAIYTTSRLSGLTGEALYIANYSIYNLFNWVITLSFSGIVITGVIYSIFTHWGMTKHWWVIGKWTGVLVSFIIVWVWLGPAINGMVALSDAARESGSISTQYKEYSSRLGPSIMLSLAIFMTMIAITIFRPWGQRVQKYTFRRSTILAAIGSTLLLLLILGLSAYFDLESYRKMQIGTPDLSQIADGNYEGAVTYAGFTYIVEVNINEHTIKNLKVLENRNNPYASFAEGIMPRVIDSQSPNVDGITGATTTSKCLMKAIEAALEGAIK